MVTDGDRCLPLVTVGIRNISASPRLLSPARAAFQVQQCNNPHKHWVFVRFARCNIGATGCNSCNMGPISNQYSVFSIGGQKAEEIFQLRIAPDNLVELLFPRRTLEN